MSTSSHSNLNVIFGNADSAVVIYNICGEKTRLFGSSQNYLSKNSIFGQFEVIFLKV